MILSMLVSYIEYAAGKGHGAAQDKRRNEEARYRQKYDRRCVL